MTNKCVSLKLCKLLLKVSPGHRIQRDTHDLLMPFPVVQLPVLVDLLFFTSRLNIKQTVLQQMKHCASGDSVNKMRISFE